LLDKLETIFSYLLLYILYIYLIDMNSDLLFSNWVFIWFVLYLCKIIPYSPKLIILIGFVVVIGILFHLFNNNASKYNILKFATLNLFMKAIPLIILYNDSIIYDDFIFSTFIFIIYLLWLEINDNSFFKIYNKLIDNYINNHTNTFISNLYDNMYHQVLKLNN